MSKILIFEGPDASGKSVLREEFRKVSKHKHMTIDRLHLSMIVYAEYYGRWSASRRVKAIREFRGFMIDNDALLVYVIASPDTLERRLMERNEGLLNAPDPSKVIAIYEEALKVSRIQDRTIIVNTTMSPPLKNLANNILRTMRVIERAQRK